ncbi:hypothetical protein Ahu01nite_089650 [Winogradskya humida]|uniref:Uncharacterized protein n=1 Tax=Winogradskya humida TaxID=113566 RepID=A0ABQ4A4S8_9ACTN|nr:hypothetical protein Ahu01nite_089650 [Actinoplanes humidus]
MHDGRKGRDPLQQRRDGVPVRDVAGLDRDGRAPPGELGDQLLGAVGGTAPAARQDDVPGAVRRQPACDMPAQGPETTGHQHGSPWCPARAGRLTGRRGCQPASQDPGAAHRDLVLAGGSGQDRHEQVTGPVVAHLGQVDETTPAVRLFERGDPAETPQHRLGVAVHGVTRGSRHGAGRHRPQRRGLAGVAERPEQADRAGDTRGDVRRAGVGESQQRDDSTQPGDPVRKAGPVHRRGIHFQDVHVGAVAGQRIADPPGAGLTVRCHEQPDTLQLPGFRGHRLPVDPVPPAVRGGSVPLLAAPRRQPGQHRTQRVGGRHVEGARQTVEVTALDNLPEPRFDRRQPLDERVERERVEPVTLALERIGGQIHPPAAHALEVGVPINRHSPHMQPADSRDNSKLFRSVSTQCGHENRIRQRFLAQRGQHTTRTDFEEDVSTRSSYRVPEPNGIADMPHPILRRRDLPRGHDRNRRSPKRHTLQHPAEVIQHRFHQR